MELALSALQGSKTIKRAIIVLFLFITISQLFICKNTVLAAREPQDGSMQMASYNTNQHVTMLVNSQLHIEKDTKNLIDCNSNTAPECQQKIKGNLISQSKVNVSTADANITRNPVMDAYDYQYLLSSISLSKNYQSEIGKSPTLTYNIKSSTVLII